VSIDPERELIKEEAVTELRAALVRCEGVDAAVRACFYRHPLFASILMSESLRLLFGGSSDIRRVTAFVARIRKARAGDPGAFPSRETEALVRACLGEVTLLDAVQPSEFSYPEIGIAIVSRLFDEWQPSLLQIQDILRQTETALGMALEFIPELAPGEDDWFAAGMPTSPFAVYLGERSRTVE
jgi:hypothetical protein